MENVHGAFCAEFEGLPRSSDGYEAAGQLGSMIPSSRAMIKNQIFAYTYMQGKRGSFFRSRFEKSGAQFLITVDQEESAYRKTLPIKLAMCLRRSRLQPIQIGCQEIELENARVMSIRIASYLKVLRILA